MFSHKYSRGQTENRSIEIYLAFCVTEVIMFDYRQRPLCLFRFLSLIRFVFSKASTNHLNFIGWCSDYRLSGLPRYDTWEAQDKIAYSEEQETATNCRLEITIDHFRVTLCLCFKTSPRAKMENEVDLHENEPVGWTHLHKIGFARRLVLRQRQKATRY